MNPKRFLIVNADDFGLSLAINQGVIESHERGIVTSVSLMVRGPAAAEAAFYTRGHPDFSLGLHVDLGEWAYRNETWVPVYEVAPLDDIPAIRVEISRQLSTFQTLVEKNPTHIDSHQHVHLQEPIRSVVMELARKLAVPVRGCNLEVRYCGEFYGQTAEGMAIPGAVSVDGLIRILATLPPGFTELACHPGGLDAINTMYRDERAEEAKVLCDPRVREAINRMGIELRSFSDLTAFIASEQ
jgi:predicted glycoside hydrolase/deacetylase ChbG (UPF0249 family)